MEHLPGSKLDAEDTTSLPLIEFWDTVNIGDVPGLSPRTLTVPHDTVHIGTQAWLSLEDFCRFPQGTWKAAFPGSWDLGLLHLLAQQVSDALGWNVLGEAGKTFTSGTRPLSHPVATAVGY